jgi:N-acetylneuraminate synthase
VLEPHVDFFKIASYQVLWTRLLREVAQTGKPVVLATGMATLDEVAEALEALAQGGCARPTLLHCVSSYPTPAEEANLAAIGTLQAAFDLPVGWSDHTQRADVVERAVLRHAATLVEFHLDLDGRGAEFPAGHCWLPADVRALFARLEAGRKPARRHVSDGDGLKEPRACEAEERRWRTDPLDGLRPLASVRRELLHRSVA